jgi:predicted MFS family arabinose efflux permease
LNMSLSKPASPAKFVTLITIVRLVLHTGQRMIYPFLPVFSRGLNITLEEISIALALATFISVASPFLAPIADRYGRRTGILLGIVIFTVGLGFVVIFPGTVSFTVSLLLTTMGINLAIPSMHSFLSDITAYSRRGLVLAVTEVAWALSFVLFVPLVGVLIDQAGWQAPFLALTCLGIVSFLIVVLLVPKDHPDKSEITPRGFNLKLVFSSPVAWYALGLGLMMVTANQVVNVVFGAWLEESYNLQTIALGAASMVIGISELAGEGLTALIVDRLGKEKSILLGFIANTAVSLVLPLVNRSLSGALIWLFFFFFTFEFAIVCTLPLMTEVLPRARATLLAVFISACSLGRGVGALVAPFLYKHGMFVVGVGAAVFNLLAILALSQIKIKQPDKKISSHA